MCAQAKKARQSIYGVHPSVALVQKWIAELQENSGRSLYQWIEIVNRDGPKSEKERREWLKTKHRLATNSASLIAERAGGAGGDMDTPEKYLAIAPAYVAEQYCGKKESLRPIYEQLLQVAGELGADVKVCPCRTMVPLYRNHVFAQIKATTNTRVDLGLSLTHYKGKLPKRIVDTGGLAKKDRITHRIELQSPAEVDQDVAKWLEIAYELDRK